MNESKMRFIVDHTTLKELLRQSDKTVSRKRKEIRLKFGLSPRQPITAYHLAKYLTTPLKHLYPFLK